MRAILPAYGCFYDGAALRNDIELDAESGQRCQDITEHNDTVGPERAPGLQRQLYGDLGSFRSVTEAEALRVPTII